MKERSKISKKIFNAILIIEVFVVFAILFIAISDSCQNTFDISIKFNNESDRIYYGGLYAGDFTIYFKVLNS